MRRRMPFRSNFSQLPLPYFLEDHPVEWEIRDKLAHPLSFLLDLPFVPRSADLPLGV